MWKKFFNLSGTVGATCQLVHLESKRESIPQGFMEKGQERKVFKLKRSIYGLKHISDFTKPLFKMGLR